MLEIVDLKVHYENPEAPERPIRALDGLSLDLEAGESLGIVGETGSGKTTLALTLMGLVRRAAIQGRIRFQGEPLPVADEARMQRVRWRRIALAFQSVGSAFDPVYTIGQQIQEPIRLHLGMGEAQARVRVAELLEQVGLDRACADRYPHQLSGGEKQRAMVAMALSCDPDLLILDEPTSGLDVLTRSALVEMLSRLRRERGLTMVVISHELADIAHLTDRTLVLYAGRVVELGSTPHLLEDPAHPYLWGLTNAYPLMTRAKDLWGIRGALPDPGDPPAGCRFHPRCTQAIPQCREEVPVLAPPNPRFRGAGRRVACHRGGVVTLLAVEEVCRTFRNGGQPIPAVRGACLTVREGEVVGLVGQTGSGKTTLARIIVGLERPDSGRIWFEDQELTAGGPEGWDRARQRMALVFQDPYEALSPRLTVLELVREPLDIRGLGTRSERDGRAQEALAAVNLPTGLDFLYRRPHELSGGQLQRIAIARALVTAPKLLIADEPVSMLDASEQAKVLRLLKHLQNERGMAMLLISHNLALVRKVCDRIAVMCAGEIVEEGPAHRLLESPGHPYTGSLVARSRHLFSAEHPNPPSSGSATPSTTRTKEGRA